MTKYHTVLVRHVPRPDTGLGVGPWMIHFGDYDRAVAAQERDDVAEEFGRRHTKIIATGDTQAEMDSAVAALNAPAEPTTYRLGSSEHVHAPGLVEWTIHGAKFPRDRKRLANVIATTWSIPMDAALALVTGKVTYAVDGETVVFAA